jgi:hypothetical protein
MGVRFTYFREKVNPELFVRYITSPVYRADPGFRKKKMDPLSNTADAVRRPDELLNTLSETRETA